MKEAGTSRGEIKMIHKPMPGWAMGLFQRNPIVTHSKKPDIPTYAFSRLHVILQEESQPMKIA